MLLLGESHKACLHGHFHISPQNLKKEIRKDIASRKWKLYLRPFTFKIALFIYNNVLYIVHWFQPRRAKDQSGTFSESHNGKHKNTLHIHTKMKKGALKCCLQWQLNMFWNKAKIPFFPFVFFFLWWNMFVFYSPYSLLLNLS